MAIFGETDVANIQNDLIAAQVQSHLVELTRLLPTVTDYSALATPGNQSVAIPSGSDLSAAVKAEGVDVTAGEFTYGADAISLAQYACAVEVEDIARVQSSIAIEQDLSGRMAVALADQIDTLIYTQLQAASASAPDHQKQYNDTTNEDLEVIDIVNANAAMNVQKIPRADRFMLVAPYQEANMLQIDSFVEADKYGSRESLLDGEIGRVFGFKVIVSNVENITADKYSIFYHKSAIGWAFQEGVKVERDRNLLGLSNRLIASFMGGCKVLDSGKRQYRLEETG